MPFGCDLDSAAPVVAVLPTYPALGPYTQNRGP
jgi:hypothetical protein